MPTELLIVHESEKKREKLNPGNNTQAKYQTVQKEKRCS